MDAKHGRGYTAYKYRGGKPKTPISPNDATEGIQIGMSGSNGGSDNSDVSAAKRAFIVVGVAAAAAVSAATAAYVFWARQRASVSVAPQAETVQQLLDRCHDQVRSIEQRLAELTPTSMA